MSTPTQTSSPSTTYDIHFRVPKSLVSFVVKVVILLAVFGAGLAVGRGKFTFPTLHWPTITPKTPDWIDPDTPPPFGGAETVKPASEWRDLPFAPGWEGYGRDVDGKFMIETWRLKSRQVSQVQQPAAPVLQYQPLMIPRTVVVRGGAYATAACVNGVCSPYANSY